MIEEEKSEFTRELELGLIAGARRVRKIVQLSDTADKDAISAFNAIVSASNVKKTQEKPKEAKEELNKDTLQFVVAAMKGLADLVGQKFDEQNLKPPQEEIKQVGPKALEAPVVENYIAPKIIPKPQEIPIFAQGDTTPRRLLHQERKLNY